MGDYLFTRTLEPSRIENGISSVRLEVLNSRGKSMRDNRSACGDRLYFEIPLEVHLVLGDKIDFHQGTYRIGDKKEPATEGTITHEDYISAEVIRRGKEILTIQSRDMRLLTQIKREYEKAGKLETEAV